MALAAALAAAPVAVSVVIGLVGSRAGGDPFVWRLVAVLVVMAAALSVIARAGAWRRTGTGGRRRWHNLTLLIVPTAVALAPIVFGLRLPAPTLLLVWVAGYAATGVFEEAWHRGVLQDVLRSLGLRRAAVIGGLLFALSHLANIAFGQPVAVSAAQAVGAFCFGVGFCVYRWRTDAVWLLAAIHGAGDLMFKITGLHGGMLWVFLVGHDTAMLLWGLWCLRGVPNDLGTPEPEPSPEVSAPGDGVR